ncbi:hypothetical protein KCU61_g4869, partial [Aureobasidium melanogenum]
MPLKLKMSSNPTDALIAADHNIDIDAADQNESANANKGGKGKHKGKLGDINMARLILSRNKGHKSSKHKKRTEVAPAPTSPLARETNAYHYKHTTYGCGHEIYEDKEGNYLARWELPEKFTTIKIADPGDCGCEMNASSNPLTTVTEHQSEPDILYKGKPVYSPRDMMQAEETGADCPEPCQAHVTIAQTLIHDSTRSASSPYNDRRTAQLCPSSATSGHAAVMCSGVTKTEAKSSPFSRCFRPYETEEVSGPGSGGSGITNSPRSSSIDSGYHSVVSQEAPDPVPYTNARFNPPAMVASSFPSTAPATPPSSSAANAAMPGAASSSSHAPVAIKTGGGLAAASMGLNLVVNGVTYPRIENGKERWYTQRPSRNNNYSRYSDLAKFDTSKGVRVAPKASRAQSEAARRYRTFG